MTLAQQRLDDLWDFSDAAASEVRLRAAAEAETDAGARAELETQVVRSLGLQERFAEAHAVLDSVSAQASDAARTRVHLERGRLDNSAGDAERAVVHFRAAVVAAASAGLVFLHVDALHMLAIADPAHAEEWTASALEVLEGSTDTRTLRWRVSLHNNAGWSRFDVGQWGEAIASFEASRDAAVRWGTTQQVSWADEALAETRAARDRA